MSRRFTLQILLPVEGYEEDKIYESEDIALTVANLKEKPDDVYYRRLKEKVRLNIMVRDTLSQQKKQNSLKESIFQNQYTVMCLKSAD